MKTAISIPDPLFEAADRMARRLGVSRSQLYARAMERYLAAESEEEVTRRLDEVYGAQDSGLDEEIREAQRRVLRREP